VIGDGETEDEGGIGRFDQAAMFVSAAMIGVAVASIMSDIGTPGWVVVVASATAWAGTGEVAYASVISTGGGAVTALAAGWLVCSRFSLLAMSMKERWRASVPERTGIYHFASEVAVAAAIDQQTRISPSAARRVFWQLVAPMAAGWFVGSIAGVALGNVVGDTRQIGLDAVFPASFIGAVVNGLTRRDTAVAVIGGAGAAIGLTPVLPAGGPVLVASGAALLALAVRPRTTGIDDESSAR